jgi:hypothetical protein
MKGQNWTIPWPQIHPTNEEHAMFHDSVDYLRHVSLMLVSIVLLSFVFHYLCFNMEISKIILSK